MNHPINYTAFLYKTSINQSIICHFRAILQFSLVPIIVQLPPVRNSLDRVKFDSSTVVRSMTLFQTSHYNQLVNNNYIRIHFKSWLNRLITMNVSVTVYNFLVSSPFYISLRVELKLFFETISAKAKTSKVLVYLFPKSTTA